MGENPKIDYIYASALPPGFSVVLAKAFASSFSIPMAKTASAIGTITVRAIMPPS